MMRKGNANRLFNNCDGGTTAEFGRKLEIKKCSSHPLSNLTVEDSNSASNSSMLESLDEGNKKNKKALIKRHSLYEGMDEGLEEICISESHTQSRIDEDESD